MAVLPSALRSGEAAKVHTKLANERRSQSPRSFTALAHLGLLARPTKTAMLPQATGKISSTAATAKCRYDLPKVRYRSNGLRCIDDNKTENVSVLWRINCLWKMHWIEILCSYVVFDHRRIDAWKRNDHSTKDWLCHVLPVNCLTKTNRKITVLLFKFHLKSTWRNKSQLK